MTAYKMISQLVELRDCGTLLNILPVEVDIPNVLAAHEVNAHGGDYETDYYVAECGWEEVHILRHDVSET